MSNPPELKPNYVVRRGFVEFNNNLQVSVIVRAGNMKEFEWHLDDLIQKYKGTVKRILYAHSERQFYGYRELWFDEVGQWWNSNIKEEFWDIQKALYKYKNNTRQQPKNEGEEIE